MSFRDQLWQDIQPIYQQILQLPFLNELSDGTLSRDRFAFYMKQDAIYLQSFARALAMTGARAPRVDEMQSLLSSAQNAILVESALHASYLEQFGTTIDVDPSPTCHAYTHFLRATAASGSYEESVAAVLPCFWIYREVGLAITERAAPTIDTNPYARWIAMYSGEEFGKSVERAISIAERAAEDATEHERDGMRRMFELAARYEWKFWDSAYRMESWPPGE